MNETQMAQLVERAADRFAGSTGYGVTPEARRELLLPALPHLPQVTRELDTRRIDLGFLERSVEEILQNALPDVRRRDLRAVDAAAVQASMARYCPYLFWC